MAFFIAFSKKLLENHFFKEQCLEQTVSWLMFFRECKIRNRKHFKILFFSSNPEPKSTPSSNRLDSGEKLIIASSDIKDVYIRPCISLTGHHMQIYTSFLIITGCWKDFMFRNKSFLGFVYPYSLLEYFQNKEID